jgi:hypothetical protein
MVAKTIGFNWGPAGTGCGVWTGVRLADVLLRCGIRPEAAGAKYVCFRGPKGELPQGAPPSHPHIGTPRGQASDVCRWLLIFHQSLDCGSSGRLRRRMQLSSCSDPIHLSPAWHGTGNLSAARPCSRAQAWTGHVFCFDFSRCRRAMRRLQARTAAMGQAWRGTRLWTWPPTSSWHTSRTAGCSRRIMATPCASSFQARPQFLWQFRCHSWARHHELKTAYTLSEACCAIQSRLGL